MSFGQYRNFTQKLEVAIKKAIHKAEKAGRDKLTFKNPDFFGSKNFRIPTKQTRGKINIAVLESICYFFSIKSDIFLKKNKPRIKRNFKRLIKNQSYLEAACSSTGSKTRVINRFKLAQEILGENAIDVDDNQIN